MATQLPPDRRTEKQIQAAGCTALARLGFMVWNLSQVRASKQTPGIADTFVTGHGICAWIEWKTRKGEQRLEQAVFERAVTRNGGHYLLARSEDDVARWAQQFIPGLEVRS